MSGSVNSASKRWQRMCALALLGGAGCVTHRPDGVPLNRFEFTQGRDLQFEPAPPDSPVNFLIYPLLEVNGKLVKTENEFSFRRLN